MICLKINVDINISVRIDVNNNLLFLRGELIQERHTVKQRVLVRLVANLNLIVEEDDGSTITQSIQRVKFEGKNIGLLRLLVIGKEHSSIEEIVVQLLSGLSVQQNIINIIQIVARLEQVTVLINHISKYNIINNLAIIGFATSVKKRIIVSVLLTKTICRNHNSA
jgi:hypothetical protein